MQFRLHYSEFTFAVVVCGLTVNQEQGWYKAGRDGAALDIMTD